MPEAVPQREQRVSTWHWVALEEEEGGAHQGFYGPVLEALACLDGLVVRGPPVAWPPFGWAPFRWALAADQPYLAAGSLLRPACTTRTALMPWQHTALSARAVDGFYFPRHRTWCMGI
jgi:hypothetical protein